MALFAAPYQIILLRNVWPPMPPQVGGGRGERTKVSCEFV